MSDFVYRLLSAFENGVKIFDRLIYQPHGKLASNYMSVRSSCPHNMCRLVRIKSFNEHDVVVVFFEMYEVGW